MIPPLRRVTIYLPDTIDAGFHDCDPVPAAVPPPPPPARSVPLSIIDHDKAWANGFGLSFLAGFCAVGLGAVSGAVLFWWLS